MTDFVGVVLCGGASRRMGTDKALVEIDGTPMALRVARALEDAGAASVVALGGDQRRLAAIGLAATPDRWPGEGPLGAIVQCLDSVGAEPVAVVLGCDLIDPDPGAVCIVVRRLRESGADVVAPVLAGRTQWMHAAWRRRVAGVLGAAFAAGERSVHGAVQGLRVDHGVEVSDVHLADADLPGDLPAGRAVGAPAADHRAALPSIDHVDIPVIDVETLEARLASGSPVVDVRQPDEYEEARVPGVTLVPLAEVPDRLDEFPTDGSVYIVCRSGARSAKAVEFLRGRGVDAVNVAGGTLAWIEAGKPVDTGA